MVDQSLTFPSGRTILLEKFITSGGQGNVYKGKDVATNKNWIVKVFHPTFDLGKTKQRVDFLISQNLSERCPALSAPVESMILGNELVYCAPYVDGNLLEEVFVENNVPFDFQDALVMAIAVAHAIDTLHQCNIAHGDIQASNFIILHHNDVYKIHGIDLDNFVSPHSPPPGCIGQISYLAPELRKYENQFLSPSISTDLYAMGVLLHEIMLLCHPASGMDSTEDGFKKAMNGKWMGDPLVEKPVSYPGGYPVAILNADLTRLLRNSLGMDPGSRPSAGEWKEILCKALRELYVCPVCKQPCLIDVSRIKCPYPSCGKEYPRLKLVLSGGGEITLNVGAKNLGRIDFGGKDTVSASHAIIRKTGPLYYLEDCNSLNGTFRWNGAEWIRLPGQTPVLIQEGDLLSFSSVEVQVRKV